MPVSGGGALRFFRSSRTPAARNALLALAAWLAVVRWLRRCRKRTINNMPLKSWEDKVRVSFVYWFVENPWLARKGLEVALLRTFSIPTISNLLEVTGGFTVHGVDRWDATVLLVGEFMANGNRPDDEAVRKRCEQAVQRLNFLHGRYRKLIANNDFIYVLSTFVVEPLRWEEDYCPILRRSPEHQAATYDAWRGIGEMMGIQDIPPSLEQLMDFHDAYEEKHMKYNKSNRAVLDGSFPLFMRLYYVPRALHGLAEQVVSAVLDQRLSKGLGMRVGHRWIGSFLRGLLFAVYGSLMPLLVPPRPWRWPCIQTPCDPLGDNDFTKKRVPQWYDFDEGKHKEGYIVSEVGSGKASPGRTGKLGILEDFSAEKPGHAK